MKNYPFRVDGVYVRNILPENIKSYKPILDNNKYWNVTNNPNNTSSYEVIWIDYYKGSQVNPSHIKARFDTITGEIFSLIDDYFNNFTKSGEFDVTFDQESFRFGNEQYTLCGIPSDSSDILELVVKKTNTKMFLDTKGIYQRETFRFIPFVKSYLYL